MPLLITNGTPVDLGLTLPAGQVFCWELDAETSEWIGVINQIGYRLKQDSPTGDIAFTYSSSTPVSEERATQVLRDFFQLDIDLENLLTYWCKCDPTFCRLMEMRPELRGLRICKQDPFECLISFIVSANNNIKRISQNLKSIRKRFGTHIKGSDSLYTFPTVDELGIATSEDLREMGLGYRAEYIVKTVATLRAPGVFEQLYSYRAGTSTDEARIFLNQFQGVGRKVSDCVSLYALEFHDLAPVDTHMLQIAQRIFGKSIKKDNTMHATVQDLMIERFGEKAGWAHCFLFAADLPSLFKETTTDVKRVKLK